MVVSAAIDYLGEGQFPAPLEMYLGAMRIGQSSYELYQLAMQGSNAVVFARVTMVCVKDGQPFPIPKASRDLANAWMMT
jgi:acyl-CoA thioester hydrolase